MTKCFVVVMAMRLGGGLTVNEFSEKELAAQFAGNKQVLLWARSAARGEYIHFAGTFVTRRT